MVSTSEAFTDNSQMTPSQYITVKNTSARKLLYQILEALDVKPKTAVRRIYAAK